jgi:hypothetical protein
VATVGRGKDGGRDEASYTEVAQDVATLTAAGVYYGAKFLVRS